MSEGAEASATAVSASISAPSPARGVHRSFSPDAENLARAWRDLAEAPMPWAPDLATPAKPGVEGGFWVEAPPYRAWAKPRVDRGACVPALEKIASDLACYLRLPVPPVTLYRRAGVAPGEAELHSVSAVPFKSVYTWGDLRQDPAIFAVAKAGASRCMSAMSVFDTWLACHDHVDHPGNLLVTIEGVDQPKPWFAYIDYSYSMTHTWRAGSFTETFVAPMYSPEVPEDLAEMRNTIRSILALPDDALERVVSAVPDGYLPADQRALIKQGLRYRRENLQSILATRYPGVIT